MKYFLLTIAICSSFLSSAQNYNWTIYDTTNSPLQCNQVDDLAVGKDNNVWIAACSSIYKLSNGNWTVYDTIDIGHVFYQVSEIAVDTNNVKWFGTLYSGMMKYDGTSWTYYDTLNSAIPTNYAQTLAVDHDNLLWAYFDIEFPAKLHSFDGVTWSEYNQDTAEVLYGAVTSDIAVDSENNKYFASGGLYIYNNSDWTWEIIYYNSNNQIGGLRAVDINANDDRWLSLDFKIRHYPSSGTGFTEYDQNNTGIPLHGNNKVAFDSTGVTWIGGLSERLIRFDGTNWTEYTPVNSPFPPEQPGWTVGANIKDIVVDHNNLIYVATIEGGLIVLEEQAVSVAAPERDMFNIFPNPAQDFVHLIYDQEKVKDKISVDIIDMNGRVIKTFHLQEGKNKHQISLEGISTGVYYLKIYISETIVHEMIIKK